VIADSNAVYDDEVDDQVHGENESEPELPECGLDLTDREALEESKQQELEISA
jgi:hypothetical protein